MPALRLHKKQVRGIAAQKQTWSGALAELSRSYRSPINGLTFQDRNHWKRALECEKQFVFTRHVIHNGRRNTCQRTIVYIRLLSTKHLCVPCSCSWTTRSGPVATTHQPHVSNVAELYLLFPPPVCFFPPPLLLSYDGFIRVTLSIKRDFEKKVVNLQFILNL